MADDEPPADLSKADLWERLRALEQRVYPDRRDVLKLAGGAVAGGAVGAAATGNASAGSAEAGQLGSAQYPQDAWVEDLYDKNDNHVAELPGDGSFNIDETQNKNYVEPQVTASEGTSYTANLSQANYHKVTLTGDVSFDFSNVDATDINSVVLHLVQDGTGGRSPSFTPTVVWDGGSAPSWSTGANAEDVITLVNDQDGSQWLGFVGGLGMA